MSNFNTQMTLKDYRQFINGLSIASMYIDDVDLRDGIIRQATPDKATTINIDFSSIFNHGLTISGLKSKLTILELIAEDELDKIDIYTDDKFWYVKNDLTNFRFAIAATSKLATKYIDDVPFKAYFKDVDFPENEIHNIDLKERVDVHKKIKKVCDTYNADKILLTVDENNISLKINSIDKRQAANIYKTKNVDKHKPLNVIIRSSFIDKLDSKMVNNIVFYKPYTIAKMEKKSVTKAVCEIEDGLGMTIYTICKVG